MNKKFLNILGIFIVIIFIILSFFFHNIVYTSLIESAQIFLYKVFPFLFIMMIFNKLLMLLNFPYYFSKLIPNPYLYIFIMSALGGSPINAIILDNFLKNKYLTEQEASLVLSFTTLNNPLFLYNYLQLIFTSQNVVFKIMLYLYLSNILILIFISIKNHKSKWQLSYQKIKLKSEFIDTIKSSIFNLISIFAIIAFFKLLCDITLQETNIYTIIAKGLIEITQGLNSLINFAINNQIKQFIVLTIIIWGGFSIHIQISNILNEYNINYKYFYLSRLILIIGSLIFLL